MAGAAVSNEKTSTLLKRVSQDLSGEDIQLGFLLYRLRRRSFGGLLFFLAILGVIPGIGIFSGLLMMMLGVQLAIGFRAPLFPRFISEYSLKVDSLRSVLNRVAPKIEKVERYIRPRLLMLTLMPFTLVLGALILCLAAMVIIPLPFTNLLPALAILVISLGFLERDGLLIIAGSVLSVFAFSISGLVIYLAWQGLEKVL